mmetsp:Transcript_104259/g.304353  ORF Transcript_104259/g.304353 Transcript_104259/m.304353 type:complete len:350 (+) Transcript_104259:32-1081(+)
MSHGTSFHQASTFYQWRGISLLAAPFLEAVTSVFSACPQQSCLAFGSRANAVCLQHPQETFAPLAINNVKSKYVSSDLVHRVVRELLCVLNQLHQLAGRVRVGQLPTLNEIAQLTEQHRQLHDLIVRHVGTDTPQQRHLAFDVGVIYGVAAEDVAADPEEVVAQEGEARPVRQHDHPEALGHRNELLARRGGHRGLQPRVVGSDNRPAIQERQLAVLGQRLQHADHLQRCLVGLVHDEAPARLHCPDQGRVLPHHLAGFQARCQGEALDRRVSVQLDILPLAAQEAQQPVRKLVLAHALVANEQQVMAKRPVEQHVVKCRHMLGDVHEGHIRHQFRTLRHPQCTIDVPY